MTRWILTLVCLAPVVTVAASRCGLITEDRAAALARWVQRKYRLPDGSPAKISEISPVEGGCYTRLHFVGSGRHNIDVVLYLTPDQKFLVPELIDFTIDPIAEENRRQAATRRDLEIDDGAASLGPANAAVRIVVFSDFECPFCRKFAETLRQVASEKGARFLFRNLPLPMHPWARQAAEAAACAQIQSAEAFWRVHDYLFQHQQEINPENVGQRVMSVAGPLHGVRPEQVRACIEKHLSAPRVQRDIALAASSQVTGTPTVFVNGERIGSGAPTREHLLTLIREAQREAGPPVKGPVGTR